MFPFHAFRPNTGLVTSPFRLLAVLFLGDRFTSRFLRKHKPSTAAFAAVS